MNDSPDNQPLLNSLLQSYKNAVLRPGTNIQALEEEASQASWLRTWITVGLGLLVSLAIQIIRYNTISNFSIAQSTQFIIAVSILATPITFLAFALLLYGLAKLFGGTGRTGDFRQDFMVHAYLIALVNTPVSAAYSVLSLLLDFAGGTRAFPMSCLSSILLLAVGLYSLILARNVLQVSRRLPRSTATCMVVLVYFVIPFLVVLLLVVVFASYLSSILQSTLPQLQQLLATPTP